MGRTVTISYSRLAVQDRIRMVYRIDHVDLFSLYAPFYASKIRGDIRKSRCTTGINDTVVDSGGKQWQQYQAADTLK
jgi:hypothetical protein